MIAFYPSDHPAGLVLCSFFTTSKRTLDMKQFASMTAWHLSRQPGWSCGAVGMAFDCPVPLPSSSGEARQLSHLPKGGGVHLVPPHTSSCFLPSPQRLGLASALLRVDKITMTFDLGISIDSMT